MSVSTPKSFEELLQEDDATEWQSNYPIPLGGTVSKAWKDTDIVNFLKYTKPALDPIKIMGAFWKSYCGDPVPDTDDGRAVLYALTLFYNLEKKPLMTDDCWGATGDKYPSPWSEGVEWIEASGIDLKTLKFRDEVLYTAGVESHFKIFWDWFVKLKVINQQRITHLVAAFVLRLVIKTEEHVRTAIANRFPKILSELLQIPSVTFSSFPAPANSFLSMASTNLVKTNPWVSHMIAAQLQIYKKAMNDDSYTVSVLRAGFLVHLSNNGMGIFDLLYAVAIRYNMEIQEVRELTLDTSTLTTWKLIRVFYKAYITQIGYGTLVPWARVLDDSYFLEFRIERNMALAQYLAGILEGPLGAASDVWKSNALKDVPTSEKVTALEMGESIREYISQNRSQKGLSVANQTIRAMTEKRRLTQAKVAFTL